MWRRWRKPTLQKNIHKHLAALLFHKYAVMQNLKNKTVLVIGGGSGIGLGIGEAFAKEGSRVVLSSRNETTLNDAKANSDVSEQLLVFPADATDRKQISELVTWTEENAGPIDILAYSAGMNVPERLFENHDGAEFDQVMDVNATGPFNAMRAVLPGMRERKSGLVLNVVSLAGLRNMKLAGASYCASKFAQGSLGHFANLEVLEDGVSVTNIYPGEANTPLVDKRPTPPPAEQRAKMIFPEDVAAMAIAVAKLPSRATVPELVITPRHMPLS